MSEQVAFIAGIYRHTDLDETKFCEIGDKLPKCACDNGGKWEFLKEDNILPEDTITLLIWVDGIPCMIETNELPEIGLLYNIRDSSNDDDPEDEEEIREPDLKTGEYQVTFVDDDFEMDREKFISIDVKRIGDLSNKLPIHEVIQI